MEIYSRKTDDFFPVHGKIMGAGFAIGGLLALFQYPLLGLILLGITAFIFGGRKGFELNFADSTYREYWGLLGLRFGEWKKLPNLQRISIVNMRSVYRNQNYRTGLSTYSSDVKTALNLRINDLDYLCAGKGKYNQIMDDVLYLSNQLDLEIIDATTDERKVINRRSEPQVNSVV
ncbi:hypothetical protein TH61_15165 [Rufibacter sp. DG15C]|uniref:hypothetical protein n=1 Tax=Rufibacter sp. DG15C TaxID=1379909 RepID=UPI00078B5DA3|nr:hypothetical protein [Rufibacter sp. DG15C]AMM52265.1 hypothetical protein TH61_15165 [Rufibacter sp. DG15C]